MPPDKRDQRLRKSALAHIVARAEHQRIPDRRRLPEIVHGYACPDSAASYALLRRGAGRADRLVLDRRSNCRVPSYRRGSGPPEGGCLLPPLRHSGASTGRCHRRPASRCRPPGSPSRQTPRWRRAMAASMSRRSIRLPHQNGEAEMFRISRGCTASGSGRVAHCRIRSSTGSTG